MQMAGVSDLLNICLGWNFIGCEIDEAQNYHQSDIIWEQESDNDPYRYVTVLLSLWVYANLYKQMPIVM